MSDETVVAFPGAKATDTLVPQVVSVMVGEETYRIASFCLAKTIRTFALMTELAQAAGLSDVLAAADTSAMAGEFSDAEGNAAVAPGFITRALAILPNALRSGTPALFRLLGLLVTPNQRLRKMEEDEEDIDAYLLKTGRDLAYEGTNDEIINLVVSAVKVIGVETIVKQLPNLMALLRGGSRS